MSLWVGCVLCVCASESEGACKYHSCSHSSVCIVLNGLPTCVCPSCSEEFQPVRRLMHRLQPRRDCDATAVRLRTTPLRPCNLRKTFVRLNSHSVFICSSYCSELLRTKWQTTWDSFPNNKLYIYEDIFQTSPFFTLAPIVF